MWGMVRNKKGVPSITYHHCSTEEVTCPYSPKSMGGSLVKKTIINVIGDLRLE
jgi:hypothetical protein